MEHLHHFKLRIDPFQNDPDPQFLFESSSLADARVRIDRALRQSKGLTVLTGATGVGKTVLARSLWEDLEEELFEAHFTVLMPGSSDAGNVLRRFARQLGIEEPGSERSELMAQLYDALAIVREDGRHTVLILDDAHMLGADAIAELGGLLNLEYEDRRLLSMLLIGLPELDEVLSTSSVVGHRVDVRTRLRPLDAPAVAGYIAHRLEVAGGSPAIVPEDAVSALTKFGRGRPRLLNSIADNALFEAFLAGRQQMEGQDVERAAADLGIGPDPGTTYCEFADPAPAPESSQSAEVEESVADESGVAQLGELLDAAPRPGEELAAVVAREAAAVPGTATLELEDELSEATDSDDPEDRIDDLFVELLED